MNRLLLNSFTTLDQALRQLDTNGNGFLPVVDENEKLIGIITDGDVRKALLRNELTLNQIINSNPITAKVSEPRVRIMQTLRELKRRHMPVVDEHGRYAGVVILDDFSERSNTHPVVVMAGGLGTRLGELTQHTPKPMLPIHGKPILLHIVETIRSFGFRTFIFCLNYKAHVIQSFFGDGSKFGVSIQYIFEPHRMGTAGALGLIDRSLLTDGFMVTNGDILTSLNYEDFFDFHLKGGALGTMCVKRQAFQLPYANVVVDDSGNMISLEEKPSIFFNVNAGIYAFRPGILDLVLPNVFLDMPSLLVNIQRTGDVVKTFCIDDYWIDIGQPQDYSKISS